MEARELPGGTVTLLFTDMEGSTRMLQELGREAYVRALTMHRRLLREAFKAHGGVEVEMQGDSLHYAFPYARGAIAAAVAGQRALHQHAWESLPVRVRIGLHTGEPMQADGLYAGLDVHWAARVMDAGHGGQVLVSQRTAEIVQDELAGEITLVDLGEHRLKDLTASQRLYQAVVGDLPSEFPSPRTLANRPTNLPTQPNRLIGREAELAEIVAHLKQGEARVITLTGPGGIGKTRLGLQVCAELVAEFSDGVFFVSLATVTDPSLVISTVAQTLGLRDQPGLPLEENLRAFLTGKRLLLLLDNFEQVADAAPGVARLLADSAGLHVLVTSREPLKISGERLYPVATLSVPALDSANAAVALEHDAVALFAERGRAAEPTFAVTDENAARVGAICARLDGLPLAIELAAARISALSLDSIARRLDRRLELLTGGARDVHERQRTLNATIGWSYDLLDDAEKHLLAGVSVFAGGCRLEAAEIVCDPNGKLGIDAFEALCSLLAKNLLRRRDDADGEPRFWMLETIRAYAGERLAENTAAASTYERLASWCVDLAEAAAEGLHSPQQLEWMQRVSAEYGNLRAALDWALTNDVDVAQRLVGSLAEYWDFGGGEMSEGRRWISEALDVPPSGSPRSRALAVLADGILAFRAGEFSQSLERCLIAVEEARALGDERLLARALSEAAWPLAVGLDDPEQAASLCDEALSLATKHDDRWCMANATACKAVTLPDDPGWLLRADDLYREIGDSFRRAAILGNSGWMHLSRGELARAAPYLEEALALAERTGNVFAAANCGVDLALCRFLAGDMDRAVATLVDAIRTVVRVRPKLVARAALFLAAAITNERGHGIAAWRLVGAASRIVEEGPSLIAIEERLVAFSRKQATEEQLSALAAGRSLAFDAALYEALFALTGAEGSFTGDDKETLKHAV